MEASVPINELDLFSRFGTVPAWDGNGVVWGRLLEIASFDRAHMSSY